MKQKLKYLRNSLITKDIIFLSYILIFIGLIILFSASKGVILTKEGFFIRQVIWVIIGSILVKIFKNSDYRNLDKISYFFYFLTIILLSIVLVKGEGRASRWIGLGWFYFQPSEFAKLVIILTLSSYLSKRDIKRFSVLFTSFLIVAIPFFLVFKQPNLGTAIIFILIFIGITYIAGISKKQLFIIFLITIFSSPLIWTIMEDYQRERILTFLNPMRDPLGKGYNLLQSKITIGSGGFIGKGFMKGTQTKLAFLPEYHTDFIFCVLAEEFGFLGVVIFVLIYFYFLNKIFEILYLSKDIFGKLISTGIFIMFASHFLINLGMTLGIFPIVGIPLPFVSYGGSCLIVSILSIIVLSSIEKHSVLF
ncbi:MAG: rod shape-determining protein RodA [Candidatus Omnitrophica bacterium]|nr:rod shape-determining protein RodA [Candidatus Omnitrophota bacterium]MCM8802413.1 rod shape-determining protein RodA [Candidatus Omnitrophota bacterium]